MSTCESPSKTAEGPPFSLPRAKRGGGSGWGQAACTALSRPLPTLPHRCATGEGSIRIPA